MPRPIFSAPFVATSLLVLAQASTAWAQTPAEIAARRGLLEQAEAASHAGNHQQALELGERAGRISMTPSLRFFLASEQQALGRLADALGNAELCQQTAERDSTLRNRAALISQCRTMITDLSPHVGRVTVQVPTPAPQGLQVTIAGQSVSDAFWGVPFVVTPGHVSIDAVAPNCTAFHREVDITAGGNMNVAVQLDAAPVTASSSPSETASSTAPSSAPIASPPPDTTPPSTGPGVAPWLLVGGGALLIAGGIVSVTAIRMLSLNALSTACSNSLVCAESNRGSYDTALGATIAGPIAIGVGAALATGGLIWFLSSRHASPARAHSSFGIAPLANGGMITFGGSL
jgi:hypothetical protein